MQRTLILAIVLFGFAAAHAQTGVQVNGQTSSNTGAGVVSDPLSVPTSSLSTLPSLSSSSSSNGSTTPAIGATSVNGGSFSASSSNRSQLPLELPGEGSDTSTQAASTTATAPGPPSTICTPPVPSTDGGSANLTELVGGMSLNGC
jgi:hypothetical protein